MTRVTMVMISGFDHHGRKVRETIEMEKRSWWKRAWLWFKVRVLRMGWRRITKIKVDG